MTDLPLVRRCTTLILGVLMTACGKAPEESAVAVSSDSAAVRAPVARIETVEDVFFESKVADPYRWLEDWTDTEVKVWSEGQNAYTRKILASLPERAAVHARITEILKSAQSVSYGSLRMAGADKLFAMKRDPAKQQSVLVLMAVDGDPSHEKPFVDPNEVDPSGGTTIDWYEPSHDGSMVAVSMSSGGSESGDVHVYKVPSGEETDVITERVNGGTAGGDLAWFPDDAGFYYTRYPRAGERSEEDMHFFQQVWRHALGTSAAEDSYVIGEDFPRIAEIRLSVDAAGDRLLVWVQDGDSNRFEMHLRQPDGKWNKFSEFSDGAIQANFGPDDSLYVISVAQAPRGRLLKLDAAAPDMSKAVEIIAESDNTLSHGFYSHYSPTLVVAQDRIYAVFQAGGPNKLMVYSLDGKPLGSPEQDEVSAIFGLTPGGASKVYFATESYVAMAQWFRYDARDETTTQLAISSESPVDYSDVTVVREFATSKDGTRVPVNILMPQGARRDGSNAVLVTGYGGYGLSMTPYASMSRHILFEHGVLFAEANLRGGGEYGEEWHLQGNLTNKQNVFDDFAAVIKHLVDQGYAARDRVAIVGGSNGGLLMGATVVQHPDLVAAAVSHVGIYDMLRAELNPNGEFNIPEFGTVNDPAQFAALRAYSPYHNIEDGVSYPPMLIPTGANDPRVEPFHSRKFTARMQAAQNGNGLVLLRTSGDTGHGGGTPLDETIEQLTDQYAFVFHHLNVPVGDQ
jgi:prolyl oligopeptidase